MAPLPNGCKSESTVDEFRHLTHKTVTCANAKKLLEYEFKERKERLLFYYVSLCREELELFQRCVFVF